MHRPPFRFRRLPYARQKFGLGETAFKEKVKEGVLPPSIQLGPRAVAWVEHELDTVAAAMVAGKSKEFIVGLVRYLVDHRKDALPP